MFEGIPIYEANDAIGSLGRSQTIETAELSKRHAVAAIARIAHSNSEIFASMELLEAAPVEIANTQSW